MLPRFLTDANGNFGVLTALLMVPLIGVAGLSVDIADAVMARNDLQAAADSAALAAIADGSIGYKAAMAMTSDGEIALAEADASAVFTGQLPAQHSYNLVNMKADIIRSGGDLKSSITFNAELPTTLLRVLGKDKITISGTANAVFQTATFRDFYLLLDNTPSMGVAATTDDINKMVANTSDKCAFACHIVKDGVEDPKSYYNLAKKIGVTIRIDVVAQATAALMTTATQVRKVANQYRMAIYTFGEKAEDTKLMQISPLTYDLNAAASKASMIDLMSIPYQGYNNDQQTDFALSLQNLGNLIGAPGTGITAASPEKIIFFVSDGVNDSYKPSGCTKKTTSGRCQEPINITACTALKNAGYKVAVLYTTYLPLPTNSWYNSWISPFQTEISTNMRNCATSGYFFEVSPSQGISDAMNALFLKIVTTPRLSS